MQTHTLVGLLIHLLLATNTCLAQIQITKVQKMSIPEGVGYKGNLTDAYQWKDKAGLNLLLRSETGILNTQKDGDTKSAELYVCHFILQNDIAVSDWKLRDFERDCELDITVAFLGERPVITDLDNDQVAEVWLLYQTACRGDVSPASMKIIMYEGAKKHAMKGTRKIKINSTEMYGGNYKFDDAFLKTNQVFRTHAQKLWKQYLHEIP